MLMDLFLQHVRGVLKTRVHFNSFMQSVHLQLHAYRTQQVVSTEPLDYVVTQIRSQTQLLCFDEFQVTNIADAMLLGRLFAKLWQQHVIVVATSNRPPDGTLTGDS
jgi:cell division protein ZapE